jgi:hypothetical protein
LSSRSTGAHQKKQTDVDELAGCGLLVISPSFRVLAAQGNYKIDKRNNANISYEL